MGNKNEEERRTEHERTNISDYGAGMGSRYGGLKQMDPMDSQGHIIMDFSIYDAIRAGFQKVVFIIKKEKTEGTFPGADRQPDIEKS